MQRDKQRKQREGFFVAASYGCGREPYTKVEDRGFGSIETLERYNARIVTMD